MTIQRLIENVDGWILNLYADARAFLVNILQFMAYVFLTVGWGNLAIENADTSQTVILFIMGVIASIAAYVVVDKIQEYEFPEFRKGTICVVVFETIVSIAMMYIFITEIGDAAGAIMCIGPVLGILESIASYQGVKKRIKGIECPP